MTQVPGGRTGVAGRMLLGLLVLTTLLVDSPVSARYLPTRADESDVEVLKELIRGLLTQSNSIEDSRYTNNNRQNSNYLGSNYSRYPHHLLSAYERRAAEVPQFSDGDSLVRTIGKPKQA